MGKIERYEKKLMVGYYIKDKVLDEIKEIIVNKWINDTNIFMIKIINCHIWYVCMYVLYES